MIVEREQFVAGATMSTVTSTGVSVVFTHRGAQCRTPLLPLVSPLRRCLRLCALGIAMLRATPMLQAQVARGVEIDLLALRSVASGAPTPAGWQTRAVRGQQLPTSRIVDTASTRFLRLSGQGQAGWFVRELASPIAVSSGRLRWTWRATLPPSGADAASPATDDAALRVLVVFARHGRFAVQPRVLYYSLADGDPPPDRRDAPHGVRIAGRPVASRDWVQAEARPFDDYRAIWGSTPPMIVAIGVMQDSDQTRRATIGDIMTLVWRSDDAAQK